MAVLYVVNLMMRNIDSKPAKAHFSAIHSLQLVPASIRGTREFAGEIMGNKSLGFDTAHLYKFYFSLSENLSGGAPK